MSSGATQLPTSQDSVPVLPAPRGRIHLRLASFCLPPIRCRCDSDILIDTRRDSLFNLLVFHTDHLAYKTV